jgi:hypothetical protein
MLANAVEAVERAVADGADWVDVAACRSARRGRP